ncbi:MAG: imidazoleglycerol-phosphate dehydratase [Planctomycetota bacterium]|jgi:imidazoleglycerol-phosphate dehydratase
MKTRTAEVIRKTDETRVRVALGLEAGEGRGIDTNLPFLDHLLSAFACHGRFGLEVEAEGDLAVDPHHLVEDCGITLGRAVAKVLGGSPAIRRAGFFLFPMDGSIAEVALDLCGRPNLVWKATLGDFPLGGIDPRLFRDFFKGWVDGARATLHVRVPYQDGDHHALEAVFKAFGRALREAVAPVDSPTPLSTKGILDD